MNDQQSTRQFMESQSKIMQRSIMFLLIHDMLPWDLEEPGMTLQDIQQRLTKVGIDVTTHTLNREMKALMSVARVHFDDEAARPKRFHRFQERRLTDSLPGPIRGLASVVLNAPDFPSQIRVKRR